MPPSRDQPGSETDRPTTRHLSTLEFVAELGALISELESAKGGSQSLDIRIHYGFRILGGHGEDMASLLIKEGVSWPTVQATLNEIVPPYSTSLDAALQGEEIVFAIRAAKGHRWGAMQRTASGGEELAWAATEPLARRLAALKSRHAELKNTLDDGANISGQGMTHRSGINPTDNSAEEEPAPADEAGVPDGAKSNLENPNRDVTRLHDHPERAKRDNQERAKRDNQERAKRDSSDQSDEEEKDWEILF